MKAMVALVVLLVIVSCVVIYNITSDDVFDDNPQKEYQGPVRPDDDLEHFRKTGVTKKTSS